VREMTSSEGPIIIMDAEEANRPDVEMARNIFLILLVTGIFCLVLVSIFWVFPALMSSMHSITHSFAPNHPLCPTFGGC